MIRIFLFTLVLRKEFLEKGTPAIGLAMIRFYTQGV